MGRNVGDDTSFSSRDDFFFIVLVVNSQEWNENFLFFLGEFLSKTVAIAACLNFSIFRYFLAKAMKIRKVS